MALQDAARCDIPPGPIADEAESVRRKISMIPNPSQATGSLPFDSPSGNPTERGSNMSKARKTAMTRERASVIQSNVDRKKPPTLQQQRFKQRTTSAAAKKEKK